MVARILLGEQSEGSPLQSEEWWYLVLEDSGARYVEHEWKRADLSARGGKPNSGTKAFSVEEFLSKDKNERLKTILRAALRSTGEAGVEAARNTREKTR